MVPTRKHLRMHVFERTAQTGVFRSVWVNLVLFRPKRLGERPFSLLMMGLMYLDRSHVKTSKNPCVYMRTAQTWLFRSVWVNSALLQAKWFKTDCSGVVLEPSGIFSALSRKTARGALFFTCYDELDVLGWFPSENIQECVPLNANGSNRPFSGRLG